MAALTAPVARFQIFSVRSEEADTARLPSGVMAQIVQENLEALED